MKQIRLTNLVFGLFLFGCNQASTSSEGQNQTNVFKGNINPETKDTGPSHQSNNTNFHTQYEYTDSNGKSLIIQNSFPKGELYTDPNGNEYAKATFWTRIINETENPLELTIDFSGDSYEIQSSVGSSESRYFKIMLPSDTMTHDKEDVLNYGLTDIDSFLVNNINKPTYLKRTINPKRSSAFYVVRLAIIQKSDREKQKSYGSGVTRAGFSLKGQNLVFTLNGKEFLCGKVNLKNLMLKNQRTTGI